MVGLAYFFTYNFLKQYLGKFLGYLVHDGKPILCCCKFDIKSKPGASPQPKPISRIVPPTTCAGKKWISLSA